MNVNDLMIPQEKILENQNKILASKLSVSA